MARVPTFAAALVTESSAGCPLPCRQTSARRSAPAAVHASVRRVEDQREARFVCVLALVGERAGETIRETFTGFCQGRIALATRGQGGFGYDPIFLDPSSGRSFAELSPEEKLARSHRGRAMVQLRAWLAGLRPRE